MKRVALFLLLLTLAAASFAQVRKLPENPEEKYTSALFRSTNAYALLPENDPLAISSFNVFQYIQGRIPGLMIYSAGTPTPAVLYRMGVPVLFLDEVRVSAEMLAAVNMSDIAYIKVFRPPFTGSFGGANGAIAVYTKKGEEEGDE
ncbi:MAG: hypothetical protein M3342_20310 [Bacteroidota bacterium]|nr:hypothetical protein [Bacteroidota bacterium]